MITVRNYERLLAERGQQICDENGYGHYTRFSDGRDACLAGLMYTVAIFSDLTEWGHGDRWCYETFPKALAALREWESRDGQGEPTGWHRHPNTGRRRPNGDASKEYVEF